MRCPLIITENSPIPVFRIRQLTRIRVQGVVRANPMMFNSYQRCSCNLLHVRTHHCSVLLPCSIDFKCTVGTSVSIFVIIIAEHRNRFKINGFHCMTRHTVPMYCISDNVPILVHKGEFENHTHSYMVGVTVFLTCKDIHIELIPVRRGLDRIDKIMRCAAGEDPAVKETRHINAGIFSDSITQIFR